jgi:hypothetical protein
MYVQEYLVKEWQQDRLRQAEQEREASQVSELRKLEKRSERAERRLVQAWHRADRLRSQMSEG